MDSQTQISHQQQKGAPTRKNTGPEGWMAAQSAAQSRAENRDIQERLRDI